MVARFMRRQLHTENYAIFLTLLRETRERLQISQQQLAERLHVQQSFVSKCETGARRLDAVELMQWLNGLHAHPEVFIREFGERLEDHRRTLHYLSTSSGGKGSGKPPKQGGK